MNRIFLAAGLAMLLQSQSVFGQGAAAQAVRNTAQGLSQTVQDNQQPLKAGPDDKQERAAPGKIDADASREFTETKSGLKYRILRKSEGKKPTATSTVECNYKGWLDDQAIFDSSYRSGKSLSFPLSGVIKGWTEGLQLIGEGGMIELTIPSKLGYGARGTPGGPIPPNAQLHFVVELIKIK
jgi:FKBP-type peptidyl-prolyl cis-trans isomerase FkpA